MCIYKQTFFSGFPDPCYSWGSGEGYRVWSMHKGNRHIHTNTLKGDTYVIISLGCLQDSVSNSFTYDLKVNINRFMLDFEKNQEQFVLQHMYAFVFCSFLLTGWWSSQRLNSSGLGQERIIWSLCSGFFSVWVSIPIHWEPFLFVACNLLLNQYNSDALILCLEITPVSP